MSRDRHIHNLLYAPLDFCLRALGHLPLGLLYPLADILGFAARYILRYRLWLVRRNIADCFPDMEESDRKRTVRLFYRHLADYFVETLRLPYMSETELGRRMRFENTELVDSMFEQGKSMVIYTSHFGNWEWITSMALHCRTRDAVYAHVYRPLKNDFFDRWFLRLRSRFNTPVAKNHVVRQMLMWRRDGVRAITGFLSDQKPSHSGSTVNVDFLGRTTPFIYGTEEIAHKLGLPVLCFDTRCESRGHYVSTIRLIASDPSELPEGEITRRYAANLEATIRSCPAAYLWSHNRWRLHQKNKRKKS